MRRWTGSGIRSKRSSTLSKAHFSATAFAAQSRRDSGERYRELGNPLPWPGPGPGPRGAGRRQGRLLAGGKERRGWGCSLRPSAMASRSTLSRRTVCGHRAAAGSRAHTHTHTHAYTHTYTHTSHSAASVKTHRSSDKTSDPNFQNKIGCTLMGLTIEQRITTKNPIEMMVFTHVWIFRLLIWITFFHHLYKM